jgi:hypothetical protein
MEYEDLHPEQDDRPKDLRPKALQLL